MEISFSKETGWKVTRASGILALLLAENPEMTWPDIYAWCRANNQGGIYDGEQGLDDWPPSVSKNDRSATVGNGGAIWFDDRFSLPSNWPTLFSQWSGGAVISELPEYPAAETPQAAAIAVATAAVVPVQTQTTFQPNTEAVQAVAVQDVAAAVPIAMNTVYPEVIAEPAPAPTVDVVQSIPQTNIFPVDSNIQEVSQAAQQAAQTVGQSAESVLLPIAAALLLS